MKVVYYRCRKGKVEVRELQVTADGAGRLPRIPSLSTADRVFSWIDFYREPELPLEKPNE
jgi:hypothetical protein